MKPQLPLADRFTGLGYRCMGYKPTPIDYGVYEMLRQRFFSSPRGRAARFAGGVVGRLAKLDLASLDLNHDVFTTGIRLWDGQSAAAYWADALTDQEIDLICGVYEVATGANDDDPQTTKVSWWPKPHVFLHSGMNTGWWSPDCERWYQKRLTAIKAGTAALHTQTEWKGVIRFFQKSRQVAVANESLAAQFLNSIL
ncbi:hypothetical protein B0H17DRAFT_931626 [Mycena rosella]|uniref:Uncharacterized protein n=1 Tax=Mycena rosella TaxID=1033263 RepID=A0AAD7DNB3_MYCRO|nr:hypothetical protein B0H17DRAFT_931626 [Mycena rosella]